MVKNLEHDEVHICEGENNTICSLLKKAIDLGIEVDIEKKEDPNVSDKQAD